ncbi:MAG: ATP phosphoribosyltransferase regulatory subunit [Pseudomonadota bacterium]
MADAASIRAEADRLQATFRADGATPVEVDVLQPADALLDLYGEDVRARAFVTQDPVRGECMLRPDFTAPIALRHLASGGAAARYTYAGKVFRQQESGSRRPAEFVQVGLEVFGEPGPQADAEIFARFSDLLTGYTLRPMTGDIGLLAAAIDGLNTTPRRKAALRRHLWRPKRFRALLDRFSSSARRDRPDAALIGRSPEIGLRSAEDVRARLDALAEDAAAAPIATSEIEALGTLMSIRETMPNALAHLRQLTMDLPAIEPAVDRLAARMAALEATFGSVDALEFEVTYGRTTLEYYDGFVFGFLRADRPDLPPVASGGRYDALTRALGGTAAPAALGGVIRPALLLEAQG